MKTNSYLIKIRLVIELKTLKYFFTFKSYLNF
jgi:hypothetical protein